MVVVSGCRSRHGARRVERSGTVARGRFQSWQQTAYNRSIASPVYADGVIVAPYDRGTTLTAISLDGEVLWRDDAISADVPTPAAVDGKGIRLQRQGATRVFGSQDGPRIVVRRDRQEPKCLQFLAHPGGRAFVPGAGGWNGLCLSTPQVIMPVVATNQVEGFTVATPVFVNGKILMRTADHLYCIGRPANE